MTVLIRSALAFDLSEIPTLECAAAQRFLETAHPELASAPPSMTDAVLDLALREDRLLVAEQDGALCGFALLDQRGEEGWLREFNVPRPLVTGAWGGPFSLAAPGAEGAVHAAHVDDLPYRAL